MQAKNRLVVATNEASLVLVNQGHVIKSKQGNKLI